MKQGLGIEDYIQNELDDLMYPTINTSFPVSPCHVDALESLYNCNVNGEVICKK